LVRDQLFGQKRAGRSENPSLLAPEKHDVLALFHAAQAGANVVAGAARRRVVSQLPATRFKVVETTKGLVFAPCTQGVDGDVHQVGLAKAG